jgi:hypothetical protein
MIVRSIFFLSLISFLGINILCAQQISDYQLYFAECHSAEGVDSFICLRKYSYEKQTYLLVVNTRTLYTDLVSADQFAVSGESWPEVFTRNITTPYVQALLEAEKNASRLQDAGITHTLPDERGVVLTIDLCPSLKPLNRDIFVKIIQNFSAEEKPVPLAVAITGVWMNEHPQDLLWLQNLEKEKEVQITWINHSYHHRFNRSLPLSRNFLLEKGTNIDSEILPTEIAMIERGMKPSVFFRFPGLVSDTLVFRKITELGLIPIGSDSWLAKNYQPHSGSIVLIHGNGNEPVGIKRFLELLQKERVSIKTKNWLLFDLQESLSEEELKK